MLRPAFGRFSSHTVISGSRLYARNYSALPRVVAPSFWQSLIPKPFRSDSQSRHTVQTPPKPISKPWNPATFFIVIFLLIGSNSINLLAIKQEFLSFSRQADAKIAALKEAIEKVQRGEEVDVKRLLGTGDPAAEQEWEEVLKELRQERSPRVSARNKDPVTTEQDESADHSIASASPNDEDLAHAQSQAQNASQTNGKIDFY